MDEHTSIGTFFALVKRHPGANGKAFSLTLGKQVWKDPTDVYRKVLPNQAVKAALGANEGDDVKLRIEVIFLPKQAASSEYEQFLKRSLRTTMRRTNSVRSV